jgi:hypothetical protein
MGARSKAEPAAPAFEADRPKPKGPAVAPAVEPSAPAFEATRPMPARPSPRESAEKRGLGQPRKAAPAAKKE